MNQAEQQAKERKKKMRSTAGKIHRLFLGKLFLIFLLMDLVLGAIGFWQKKRNPGKESGEDSIDKAMNNAVDLNDRFNRARYMDEDGK